MTPEEFRKYGHETVDWIAEYMEGIRDYPVLSKVRPGELTASLPGSAPEKGETMEAILADFRRVIVPANTQWNHPRFHAYFAVGAAPEGVLAEMLSAALNVNGMLWKSSPAATELEMVTCGWLREWLGLPDEYFGMIHDTASTGVMHALAAACHAADGSRSSLVLYCTGQTHSSVEKAAAALGIGHVRKVAVDGRWRMDPAALEQAVQSDIVAELRPCCVVATVGTTAVAAIDPVKAVADVAQRHALWLHVDGAYGGPAAIVESRRGVLAGAERAQSVIVNPHKWMNVPVDCSVLYTRRPEVLRETFSLVPEYLRTAEDASAVNLMDYAVALGRRFRALKLWFVMRAWGRERMAAMIDAHCRWARELAEWIEADARFEVAAPVELSLVCFRHRGGDEAGRALMEAINGSGFAFLSHTVLDGRFVLRFAIGNHQTTREDVRAVWERIAGLA
ncbi:MAG: aminotransferase class I/II-fold pyridoxal phosphate-dependent enzyme [Bryobacteraceae bacterium]